MGLGGLRPRPATPKIFWGVRGLIGNLIVRGEISFGIGGKGGHVRGFRGGEGGGGRFFFLRVLYPRGAGKKKKGKFFRGRCNRGG